MNDNAESLLKDPSCQKSREHFLSAMRVLELVQIGEIEMLLETITGVSQEESRDDETEKIYQTPNFKFNNSAVL